ncbi:hypothetical protein TPMD03_54 [Thiohalocapsa phage LS06-2018-MD03]|nr:hypothetical protein TPMD03_54 [Thiohalocapsa phage LS06-2018-MD03]
MIKDRGNIALLESEEAKGVSFDGSTDYLSRSTDLAGNTDSKTFTFSCWVYRSKNSSGTDRIYSSGLGNSTVNSLFAVDIVGITNKIICRAWNSSGSLILDVILDNILAINTWSNIQISIDLANPLNKGIVINDVDYTSSATFPTYTNDTIDFTVPYRGIGFNAYDNTEHLDVAYRMYGFVLDYTHRDLSVVANRRLFITEDLKPVDTSPLNAILDLPMESASTAHINRETGGDFVQNGTLATVDRGANQPNGTICVIDGSNYLTHATESGATLSYWSVNNGIMIHNYSTGSVSIGDITSALGDAVGEVYLTTATIDESEFITNDGICIPVREVIQNTGDNPKIALPCSADNPTLNLGSTGDYGKIGSPSGYRGGSEYISRSAIVDTSNYLTGSVFCQSLVKWTSSDSGVTWNVTYSNSETVTNIGNGINNGIVSYYFGFSDNINWALETNKNLITNQLGYPRKPSDVIRDSEWTPVLGLFFDDSNNYGLNRYGADFTVNGTISQGEDFNI